MNYIKQRMLTILIGALVFAGSGVGAYMLLESNDKSEPLATPPVVTETTVTPKNDDRNEACDAFSKVAIASAFGGAYTDGEPGYASDLPQSIANPGQKSEGLKNYSCSFEQENDGTPAGKAAALGLAVTVNNFSNATDAQKYMDTFIEMLEKGDGWTKADGVGDQSFFASSTSGEEAIEGIEMLYVRIDKKVYVLVAGSEDPINRQDIRRKMIELTKEL